jgi:cell division protein FtsI/penicillin-binding protein 2
MRAAVTGGTAGVLAALPAPAAGKTGTAQDGSLPAGSYDNWLTAVAPADDPRIVVTALVQGPGGGANSAKTVVAGGLRHYLEHEAEVLATEPAAAPG